jgi:formylglycine-generating enzyme required for sulfatase activity
MRPLLFLLFFAPLCLYGQRGMQPATAKPADGSRRMALLIGNSDYQHSRKLTNPVHDVDSMETVLRELGFDVLKVKNADKPTTFEALKAFTQRIETDPYAVALVFFAGHGLQVNGVNYLVPVEANPQRESDVEFECIPADRFMKRMSEGGVSTKILLLDACRNNPLPRSWGRSGGSGLAYMAAPRGTFIGFATAPGEEALDGSGGRNSPYTTAILRHIREPGLDIDQVFTLVTKTTGNLTMQLGKQQVPFKLSSLPEAFYFTFQQTPAPTPTPTPVPLPESYTDSVAGTFILVKGGVFDMGCTGEQRHCNANEKPVHTVTLRDFYMAVTEVTVEQFKHFVDETGYRTDAEKDGGSYFWEAGKWVKQTGIDWRFDAAGQPRPASAYNHPVIHVSWNDGKAYAKWLSTKGSGRYRLPTEAEWEYAARGGRFSEGFEYAGSRDIDEIAWVNINSDSKTQPVRSKDPNALGMYDISGNVWEWCADWYNAYSSEHQTDPFGRDPSGLRVYRGGSWNGGPAMCRVAFRLGDKQDMRGGSLGFRLARTP